MKSIYIHIPFCLKKCLYCDFYSLSDRDDIKNDYVKAVTNHIKQRDLKHVETIFIGGGTPTSLSEDQLYRLMDSLSHLSPKEFTVEANPGTITPEKLKILRDGKVTRLSIGMQSSSDRLLKIIGRTHTNREFLEAVETAKKFGFELNADAMFSLPSQTEAEWEETLKQLINLDIPHVSCYSLTIAENTPFGKRLPAPLPDEDSERKMQKMAVDMLGNAGIKRYEISNFAKENHRCMHNFLCWHGEEYAAFGAAAHGYEDGVRYCFEPDIYKYIKNPEKIIVETLSEEDRISELCMLSLRLTDGISEYEFSRKFGIDIYRRFKDSIDKNISLGLLKRENGRIFLTDYGFDFANTVMEEFI